MLTPRVFSTILDGGMELLDAKSLRYADMSLRDADTSLPDLIGRLSLRHAVRVPLYNKQASAIQNSFSLKLLVLTCRKKFILFFSK